MKFLLSLSVFFLSACVHPSQNAEVTPTGQPLVIERDDWREFFDEVGGHGCFVLKEKKTETTQLYNLTRAKHPYTPASTFKIPNSIIALDSQVVESCHEVFPWDGQSLALESWERDHTLASAYRDSVVPIYQKIARKVGDERMQLYLRKFAYGNQNPGGGIDRFWLDGDLRISALEQIDFLSRLEDDSLPISKTTLDVVKDIMIYEKTDDAVIRAKTGWALRRENPIGWWVGWVEKEEETYFFAMNIDLAERKNVGRRQSIAKRILRAEGILK